MRRNESIQTDEIVPFLLGQCTHFSVARLGGRTCGDHKRGAMAGGPVFIPGYSHHVPQRGNRWQTAIEVYWPPETRPSAELRVSGPNKEIKD